MVSYMRELNCNTDKRKGEIWLKNKYKEKTSIKNINGI